MAVEYVVLPTSLRIGFFFAVRLELDWVIPNVAVEHNIYSYGMLPEMVCHFFMNTSA